MNAMMILIFSSLLFATSVRSIELSDDKKRYYISLLGYNKPESVRNYYAENICLGSSETTSKYSIFNVTHSKKETYSTREECLSGSVSPKEVSYIKYSWYGLYETIPLLDHVKYITYSDKDCSHYDVVETYLFNECGIYTDDSSFVYKDWSAYGGYIYRAQYNGAYCEQYLNAFAIPLDYCSKESYGSMKYVVRNRNSTILNHIIVFTVLLLFLL